MERTKPEITIPAGEEPGKALLTDDLEVGTGEVAQPGHQVEVHYVGVSWKTGEQFDASWDRGETFRFKLGAGQVIPGWEQGVAGMKVGGPPLDAHPARDGLRRARRRWRDRPERDARVRGGPAEPRLAGQSTGSRAMSSAFCSSKSSKEITSSSNCLWSFSTSCSSSPADSSSP